MKFEIELRKESYMVVTVEADTPDEAEDKALKERPPHEIGMWSIESVEELP